MARVSIFLSCRAGDGRGAGVAAAMAGVDEDYRPAGRAGRGNGDIGDGLGHRTVTAPARASPISARPLGAARPPSGAFRAMAASTAPTMVSPAPAAPCTIRELAVSPSLAPFSRLCQPYHGFMVNG